MKQREIWNDSPNAALAYTLDDFTYAAPAYLQLHPAPGAFYLVLHVGRSERDYDHFEHALHNARNRWEHLHYQYKAVIFVADIAPHGLYTMAIKLFYPARENFFRLLNYAYSFRRETGVPVERILSCYSGERDTGIRPILTR